MVYEAAALGPAALGGNEVKNEFEPFSSHAEALAATRAKRDELYAAFGARSPMARLGSVVPSFAKGEPGWPASTIPSLTRIDTADGTVFFTDGLSDPSDPHLHPGLEMPKMGNGVELFVAVQPRLAADGPRAIQERHWAEHLLWEVAGAEVSNRFQLYLGTSDHGALTTVVPPYPGLERFILRTGEYEGNVPLLVGANLAMGFRELPLPLCTAVPLSLSPLLESEYAAAVRAGNAGGRVTAALFAERGWGFWNRIDRPDVYDRKGG